MRFAAGPRAERRAEHHQLVRNAICRSPFRGDSTRNTEAESGWRGAAALPRTVRLPPAPTSGPTSRRHVVLARLQPRSRPGAGHPPTGRFRKYDPGMAGSQ
jgi:hypothetical protein